MKEDAVKRREFGERIIYAIEISSCRNVEIPPGYTVDEVTEEDCQYIKEKIAELYMSFDMERV